MYFAFDTLIVMYVRCYTFKAIDMANYARQVLPTGVIVAQWGTRHLEFHDNLIESPESEMSKFTCPYIGLFSQYVKELWFHWDNIALLANEISTSYYLLAARPIEYVD